MTNQLSKAALKSTAELIAHLEARQLQTTATIAMLKTMLAETPAALLASLNGHGEPQNSPTKAERIVQKAKARFARHAPHRPAQPGRMTPEVWRARIVDILTAHQGDLVSIHDIRRQTGVKSNVVFKHLTEAVKAGVISRAPGPKGFYVLGRHAGRQAAPAKKAKKHGVTLNVKAQRQRSLALLNTFSTATPKPLGIHVGHVGKLISHGYLKRTKDGYLRTDKVYEVTPS